MKANKKYDHAFAILRNHYYGNDRQVTVTKVMWDADAAKKEVERLNDIGISKYEMQITRIERLTPTGDL